MAFLDISKRADIPELIDSGIEAFRSMAHAETDDEYMTAMTRLMNSVSELSEIGSAVIEGQAIAGCLEKLSVAVRRRLH